MEGGFRTLAQGYNRQESSEFRAWVEPVATYLEYHPSNTPSTATQRADSKLNPGVIAQDFPPCFVISWASSGEILLQWHWRPSIPQLLSLKAFHIPQARGQERSTHSQPTSQYILASPPPKHLYCFLVASRLGSARLRKSGSKSLEWFHTRAASSAHLV